MKHSTKAEEYFQKEFSCSQAVLAAFSEEFGLPENTALKISQSFGGGMAHMGLTCGAVTGALLVIGLKYGRIKAEDEEAKQITYEKVQEFVSKFKALNGSINCTELLGEDLSTPEGASRAQDVFRSICPNLVRQAADILDDIL